MNETRFPWSQRFVRIFRDEKAAGSNPASSTNALTRAFVATSNAQSTSQNATCSTPIVGESLIRQRRDVSGIRQAAITLQRIIRSPGLVRSRGDGTSSAGKDDKP